jgi:hypothetical protein
MSSTVTLIKPAIAQADLAVVKQRQQGAWSSGDYAVVGTTLQKGARCGSRERQRNPRRRAALV